MGFDAVLLAVTLALYCGAAAMYLHAVVRGSDRAARGAVLTAVLGLALQGISIILGGMSQHRMPYAGLLGSLTFVTWALVALYLMTARRYRVAALGAFVCLVAALMLALRLLLPRSVDMRLMSAPGDPWSAVHIAASLISYAGFTLAFAAAVGYMVQQRMLKAKRISGLQKRLPSLDVTDHLAYRSVSVGFFMLTLGIMAGSVWASSIRGAFWSWSGRETWSLVTWLVYAAYLHLRGISRWHGKWSSRLLIIGYFCALITLFGTACIGWSPERMDW